MNLKRIIPGKWYQTVGGIGKCQGPAGGNTFKFEIDGNVTRITATGVQHEIAKGEEPQEEEPAMARNHAEEADQAYREIEGDAEIVRLREMNASMLAGLERVAKWINESAGNFSDDPADDECPVFVRTLIRKAKGG